MRLSFALAFTMTAVAGTVSRVHAQTTDRVASALADLAPRYAEEFALRPGWYRGTPIRYYDFGPVKSGTADAYWPIHGFAADSEPVPLRGQRPIFSTLPGLENYTSLWTLHYVVVADRVAPNALRSVDDVMKLVLRKQAILRDARGVLNLPIVARGSYLEGHRDDPTGHGWYRGSEVAYFDFGLASTVAAPIYPFVRAAAPAGDLVPVEGQRNVVDVIPNGTTPSVDLWDVVRARVDSSYVANNLTSASAMRAAESAGRVTLIKVGQIRNCPVALIDDRPVARMAGPLTRFAIPEWKGR